MFWFVYIRWNYIVPHPTAQKMWVCCNSMSPGPTRNEAENVFPLGTCTQNGCIHSTYRDIYFLPHILQRHRHWAFAWTQTAPVATSCSLLWLNRTDVPWWEHIYIYIYEYSVNPFTIWIPVFLVAGTQAYELLRLQAHSWCRTFYCPTALL